MISIHAPARGATKLKDYLEDNVDISIHAPAKGATDNPDLMKYKQSDFNPRSREGSDDVANANIVVTRISIHAPARGAT